MNETYLAWAILAVASLLSLIAFAFDAVKIKNSSLGFVVLLIQVVWMMVIMLLIACAIFWALSVMVR